MTNMEGQSESELQKQTRAKQRAMSSEDARIWSEHRPWPVRALTVLLAVQAAATLALTILQVDDWPAVLQQWSDPEVAFFLPLPFLALLGLIAVIGFVWLRPGAWVVAMLVQGLHLIVTLTFYFFFEQRAYYLFAMMFLAVVMVIYLNYAEVPAVFRVAPGQDAEIE
jgi:hypothetical protein